MSRVIILLCALSAVVFAQPQSMTDGEVASAFRGEWVPTKARCTSSLRLIIEPNIVTFVKGTDQAEFKKLEQCFSCMGHDVTDITLLSTDAMGDSPFMIYLDGTKKKPGVTVEFPNDKKLGARFPFDKGALKKCK